MQIRKRSYAGAMMSTKKVLGKNAESLKDKTVLIVGAGGLGCTVANLLARISISLIVIDFDVVRQSNLERQILYDKADLSKKKVKVLKQKLEQFADITAMDDTLMENNIKKIIPDNVDLIIDCTDNAQTRLLLNRYCLKKNINWIYSGAVGNVGAIFFVDNHNKNPCYECLQQEKEGQTNCEIGVLNSLVVFVASLTVNVAVNYLANAKIEDNFLRINLNNNNLMKIAVRKNTKCICSAVEK